MSQVVEVIDKYNFSPIIPLTNYSKTPYVQWSNEDWRFNKETYPKAGTNFSWVNSKGENKSGKVTGHSLITGKKSGIMVIDLDVKDGKNGIEIFKEMLREALNTEEVKSVVSTLVTETPSGGQHYYFKYREGLENKADYFDGIDVRTDGGIIILPGTTLEEGKEYTVKKMGDIQEMPDAMFQKFYQKCKPKQQKNSVNAKFDLTDPFVRLRGMKSGDGRNEALNSTLFAYCTKKNITDETVIIALAEKINKDYFAEPEEGYLSTALSVYKHMNQKTLPKREVNFIPLGDSLEISPIKEHDFLINRLLYDNAINLISGDPKTYKTYVAIDIAIGVILGTEAIGHKVLKPGKVLFASTEFDVRKRFIDLMRGRGVDTSDKELMNQIIPFDFNSLDTFQWKKDLPMLKGLIEEYRPKLFVIDPLTYIFDGDISKNDEVTEFFKELKSLINAYDMSILLIHHNNRMNETKRMNNVSGASAITRFADSIIYLERFEEEEAQDINKSDEDIDQEMKPIKLLKGPYRHGQEGYKYYSINFKIKEDVAHISAERFDIDGREDVCAGFSLTGKDRISDIEDQIIYALNSDILNVDKFTFKDVITVVLNRYGIGKRVLERDLRLSVNRMVDGRLLIKDGYAYRYNKR